MVAAEERRLTYRLEKATSDESGEASGGGLVHIPSMTHRGLERLFGRTITQEEYDAAQVLTREELQRAAAGFNEERCKICGGLGLMVRRRGTEPDYLIRGGSGDEAVVVDCRACPVEVRRARNLTGTMPPEDYERATFDTFVPRTAAQAAAIVRVISWARREPDTVTPFLILSGPVGVGKTHLAKAAALYRAEHGERVHWSTSAGMLESITRTFEPEDRSDREWMARDQWADLPTLALDDLGAEQPTEWRLTTLEHILADRYEAYAPTIITTNHTLVQIAERHDDGYGRLVSRLADGVTARRSTYLEVGGKDWRAK